MHLWDMGRYGMEVTCLSLKTVTMGKFRAASSLRMDESRSTHDCNQESYIKYLYFCAVVSNESIRCVSSCMALSDLWNGGCYFRDCMFLVSVSLHQLKCPSILSSRTVCLLPLNAFSFPYPFLYPLLSLHILFWCNRHISLVKCH